MTLPPLLLPQAQRMDEAHQLRARHPRRPDHLLPLDRPHPRHALHRLRRAGRPFPDVSPKIIAGFSQRFQRECCGQAGRAGRAAGAGGRGLGAARWDLSRGGVSAWRRRERPPLLGLRPLPCIGHITCEHELPVRADSSFDRPAKREPSAKRAPWLCCDRRRACATARSLSSPAAAGSAPTSPRPASPTAATRRRSTRSATWATRCAWIRCEPP